MILQSSEPNSELLLLCCLPWLATGLLMPEEIAWLLAQRHRPLAVGQALSTILNAIDADSIVKSRIDRLISTYTYEFGGCNRIYNTAIPSAYTR